MISKVQNWLLKNTFAVSVFLTVSGLFFFVKYAFMDFHEGSGISIITLLFDFNTVYLEFFRSEFFSFEIPINEGSYRIVHYFNLLFHVIFAIGTLLYRISKKKEKRLLQFCYSLLLICAINAAVYTCIRIGTDTGDINIFFRLFILLKVVFIFFLSFTYLRNWSLNIRPASDDKLKLTHFKEFKFKRPSRFQRFAHYSLDTFLVILIYSQYIFYIPQSWNIIIEDLVGANFLAPFVFLLISSFYYIVFEGLFRSTPAKFLTQSSVWHLKDKPVIFPQIVGRSLFRRIPLNTLSFFAEVGWHDQLSTTTVVKNDVPKSNYRGYFIVVFGIMAILFIFSFIREYYREISYWF